MNSGRTYRRKESIVRRVIAGEAFLIPVCGSPVDMENIFVLNPMADFIWERLDGGQALEAILADIVAGFAVSAETAANDMTELIDKMLANGLIEEAA